MSVKLSFQDGSKLNQIFDAIVAIEAEVDLKLDEKGLTVRQMDNERVAMIDLFMKREMFSEYQLPNNEKQVFSVDLHHFKKIKLKDKPVTLTFNLKTAKCLMQSDSPFGRIFSIPIQTSEVHEVPQIKGEFDATAKITLEVLRNVIEDAKLCGDCIAVEASKDRLMFHAKGDLLTYDAEIPLGSDALLELACKSPCKAHFTIRHFDETTKASTAVAEIAVVKLKTDFPMLITLEPKEIKELELSYALAPRIEPE